MQKVRQIALSIRKYYYICILYYFAHNANRTKNATNNYMKKTILHSLFILCTLLSVGCNKDKVEVAGGIYHFSADSYAFGVQDSEEWFEIPIIATLPHSEARNIGIEVVASESSAIEGVHFSLESHTLRLKADKEECKLRIKGNPESFEVGDILSLKLRLAVDDKFLDQTTASECEVILQRCCPFDINRFDGYAVLTSTWCMQYMNSDSRLVHTHVDAEDNIVVIEDMFYDGYDIRVKLEEGDRLNPIAALTETQILGSTGEAFGTIYGDGKILITEAKEYTAENMDLSGYISFYSMCEGFMMLYTIMYVDGVGEIGLFGNILEWISDDEAERIMREGF